MQDDEPRQEWVWAVDDSSPEGTRYTAVPADPAAVPADRADASEPAPVPASRLRRIFVAYPYSIPKDDYRRPFQELAKAFGVKFQFADERITNKQILDKITDMIVTARFSLFDVTTWNANVALELGIAMGRGRDYYLLFNPSNSENPKGGEVSADLGGLDRIHYHSYAELEEGLTKLLIQEFGVPSENEQDDPVRDLRERVPSVLASEPGLKIGEIAKRLHIPVEVAQVVVRPLVTAGKLETTGAKKGTRYYLEGAAPRRGTGKSTLPSLSSTGENTGEDV